MRGHFFGWGDVRGATLGVRGRTSDRGTGTTLSTGNGDPAPTRSCSRRSMAVPAPGAAEARPSPPPRPLRRGHGEGAVPEGAAPGRAEQGGGSAISAAMLPLLRRAWAAAASSSSSSCSSRQGSRRCSLGACCSYRLRDARECRCPSAPSARPVPPSLPAPRPARLCAGAQPGFVLG